MELALINIDVAFLIISICMVAFIFLSRKSKRMTQIVTLMVFMVISFAIQIPRLILRILIGEEYIITIVTLVVWALAISFSTFFIGKMIGKEKHAISLVVEILDGVSQEDVESED